MKICVLTIATGHYSRFLPVLRASVAWRFLVGHDVRHLIFTDCDIPSTDTIRIVRIPHEPWPLPTLRRYDHFRAARDVLLEHDYCFYLDADMRVDRPVGDEILGELVATRHPYQSLLPPARMSFERDPRSLACVAPTEGTMYYAGGFNGGSSPAFVALADALADAIARDRANGIVATWHDESHLNRYLVDHPPTVCLSPSYCFPEEWYDTGPPPAVGPVEPRIVALTKQHEVVRAAPGESPAALAVSGLDARQVTVSVVLCTRNPRWEVFDRVLAALAKQTLPPEAWELLVVDNGSDPPLGPAALPGGEVRCRTVVEPAIGLTAARVRGINEATGDLLVFVDDDNLLDPRYLAEAAAIAETRPDLGAYGGRISPEFASTPPAWLEPFRAHLALVEFARDAWSRETFPHDVLPCGAGMCVRRLLAVAWARAAAADPRRMGFGRAGDSLASAEDTDMALSCIDSGYATGRFTALHLTHVIPAGRLEFDYQLRLARGLGLSYGRLLRMRGDLDLRSHAKVWARTLMSWLGLKYRGPARAIDLAYHRGFLEGAWSGNRPPMAALR
jgi:hypothetical protein